MIECDFKEEYICGIDEVGRGCLAGPVVAAAVVMPKDQIKGITDSKKLSKKKREDYSEQILNTALAYGFGSVSNIGIDDINIKKASIRAMEEALENLCQSLTPDLVLVDAETINTDLACQSLIKGDELSYNIACASIIAKVYRDNMFDIYADLYPGYGFETNMGYGTKAHREAIKGIGYTPIHRMTFLKKMGDIKKNENW